MNEDRNEIVRTIKNISAISEDTAAASAVKLNEISNELNKEINVFKV